MSFPWFLLLIIFLCHHHHSLPALADPRATEAATLCTNRTSPMPQNQRKVFLSNFYEALEALTSLVTTQRYGTVVKGTTQNTTVYAFGECMKDLSKPDCDVCFAQCKARALRCSPFQRRVQGGRYFFDGCYLRYEAYNFFNQSLSSQDMTLCGNTDFSGNRSVHEANMQGLVRNLSVEAPKNDGFFVGSVNLKNVSVYGLAQCWNFVNQSLCKNCLDDAVTRIGSCALKEEGRVLNAGCYLRFSTENFYNSSNIAPPGTTGSRKLGMIVAESSAAVATLLIVATAIFFVRNNVLKRRERRQFGKLLLSVNNSKLHMPYEILEKATNYFNDSNKLGEGGSGSVYKGVLPDGKTVAIKRLSFNTTQWVDHFFNEVNLISGIQHKNLVKLLGCSITGPESLLVYEYVPNLSLHDHLSVRRNLQQLTWEIRRNIILGTAEGLAYLHEESQLRIIHRDIKLSNVLLDDSFTPKIADFGLARLFPEDQSHISTAICGTLGYMAPEYIVLGKLTEKADIYSFGVLVIELLSGKKRTSFLQNSCSILHMVWSLYGSNRLCDIVDPILEANYPAEEACKLLKIGLLCTQASAELRPPMSVVVKMINKNHEIADPTQPPFLNSGSAEFSRSSLPEDSFQPGSYTQSSGDSMTKSLTQHI